MLPIRLEAYRWSSGYRRLPDEPNKLAAEASTKEPLVIERPDLEDPVFVRLANCRSDEDLVRFANRYADRQLEYLDVLSKGSKSFRDLALKSLVRDATGQRSTSKALNKALSDVSVRAELRAVDGAQRLFLVVDRTEHFMMLEIAAALDANADATACRHCQKIFLFGPHTGRRSHGKYCSDRCRVAASRSRGKEAQQ